MEQRDRSVTRRVTFNPAGLHAKEWVGDGDRKAGARQFGPI